MLKTAFQLERLDSRLLLNAGQLDDSFGDGGTVPFIPSPYVPSSSSDSIKRLLPLKDGRFYAYGRLIEGTPVVERFSPSGELDGSFPRDNLLEQFTARNLQPVDCALTADEKLLVSAVGTNGRDGSFVLRFTHRGKIDKTFGHNGVARTPAIGVGTGMTCLSDGRIVMSVLTDADVDPDPFDHNYTEQAYGLLMLHVNGKVDTRFGRSGVLEATHTYHFSDSLFPEIFSKTVEEFFALPGGRFMYLHAVELEGIYWDTSGQFHGSTYTGSVGADVYDVNGERDESFVFDRAGVLDAVLPRISAESNTTDWGDELRYAYMCRGATQLPDGSVRFAYVVDTGQFVENVYPDDHVPNYNVYAATIGPDGTISSNTLLAANFPSRDPRTVFSPDGEVYLVEPFERGMTRYHRDGGKDATFALDEAVQEMQLNAAFIADDGGIVAAALRSSPSTENSLVKLQTSDAPAGVFHGTPIRAEKSSAERFEITWHDEDGVDVDSLTARSIVVYAPDGSTRTAVFESTLTDITSIKATYHIAAPGGAWDVADNGEYRVQLRSGFVKDVNGHAAQGRTLGRFFVAIDQIVPAAPLPALPQRLNRLGEMFDRVDVPVAGLFHRRPPGGEEIPEVVLL
jgi:hypothetical protein